MDELRDTVVKVSKDAYPTYGELDDVVRLIDGLS